MERKQTAKKTKKIYSQGSTAHKKEIARGEFIKRAEEKIRQKKYSCKERRHCQDFERKIQEEKRKDNLSRYQDFKVEDRGNNDKETGWKQG